MTDTPLLLTEIPFDLPGKVFRSPMPFSAYDRFGVIWELYKQNNIDIVVMLVEPEEYLIHIQRDLPGFYRSEGLDVINFPIPDCQVPKAKAALEAIIDEVISSVHNGKNLAIHCMAGLGRTGTFLACMVKRYFGFNGPEAIAWIRGFVPGAIESSEQEKFVLDF
jgi:atypical dual specificity phosphatase